MNKIIRQNTKMADLTGKYFEKGTAFILINYCSQFPEPPTLMETLHIKISKSCWKLSWHCIMEWESTVAQKFDTNFWRKEVDKICSSCLCGVLMAWLKFFKEGISRFQISALPGPFTGKRMSPLKPGLVDEVLLNRNQQRQIKAVLVSAGQGEGLWKAFTLLLRRRVEPFALRQVKDKAVVAPD